MALRTVRTMGDEILTKKCRELTQMKPRFRELIDDMFETMYALNGVGLAAPQVGVLRCIVVIDAGQEERQPLVLINPKIVEMSGEQTGQEACLSVPNKAGDVTRANYVRTEALNADMEKIVVEGEGLLARAIQHEIDHLSGILYVSKVEGELYDTTLDDDEEEEEEEQEQEEEKTREK